MLNTFFNLKENKNLALSLEGGGARGAYQIGAIKALFENGYSFSTIVGTSIGAINGAYIAQGDFDKLYTMWQTLSFKDLLELDNDAMKKMFDINLDKDTVKYFSKKLSESIKNGGLDVTSERRILQRDIDEEKLRNSDIRYGLVAMCVSDIKGEELFIEDIPKGYLIDYIMASSNLPIFKRVIINKKRYLDGGAWDNCPIGMLEQAGAKDVIVIRCHKRLGIKNYKNIVKRGKTKIYIVEPVDALPSILNFDSKNLNEQIVLGYYDGIKLIKSLDGIRFYFEKFDEKEIYDYIDTSKIELMLDIIKKCNVKLKKGKNIVDIFMDKCILSLGKKTKNRFVNLALKEAFLSILEEIAMLNNIERFKIYKLGDFILEVKKCGVTKNRFFDFKEFVELLK